MALPAGLELWSPRALLAIQHDERFDTVPDYFMGTYFQGRYYSEDREIKLSKLPMANRFLAPFVLPTEKGKPIFKQQGETLSALTTPYIKPKDAVRAAEARNITPSEIYLHGGTPPGPAQRFDQRVAEVTQFHMRAIQMQQVWMAARALIDGKVQVSYERETGQPFPNATIDFGRSAAHTVTLGAGARWDDPDHDILGDITSWLNTMYLTELGGTGTRMYLGSQARGAFLKNKGVKELLNRFYGGAESVSLPDFRTIQRTVQPLNYVGKLDNNLEVYSYRDVVQNNDGTLVEMFDPRDVLITCPGIGGVMAFGAIEDAAAYTSGMQNAEVFPKMWYEEDPGDVFIMHQSAPLPIPVYPNRTFKARVLA